MSFSFKVLKQNLSEWFRVWQAMFAAYLFIFTLASFGGYTGDVLVSSLVNSLTISLVYYSFSKVRNSLILYAKRIQSNLNNTTSIGHKMVNKALENYDKQNKEEE